MALTSVHILIQIPFEIVDNEDLQMYSNMFSSFYLFIFFFYRRKRDASKRGRQEGFRPTTDIQTFSPKPLSHSSEP